MYLSSFTLILLGLLWWLTLWNQEREHTKRLQALLRPEEAAYEAWQAACESTDAAITAADVAPNTATLTHVRQCELREKARYDAWQAVQRRQGPGALA